MLLISCGACRWRHTLHINRQRKISIVSITFFNRLTPGYLDMVPRPAASAPPWGIFRNIVLGPAPDLWPPKCRFTRFPGDLSSHKRAKSTRNSPGHRCHRFWNQAGFVFQIDDHWLQDKLGPHRHNWPRSAGRRCTALSSPVSSRRKPLPTFPALVPRVPLTA